MKVGDYVEIYPCIASLQPLIYEDKSIRTVKKTKQQFGQVMKIDGAYINVRPKGKSWTIECYPEELRIMTSIEYKAVQNYTIKH